MRASARVEPEAPRARKILWHGCRFRGTRWRLTLRTAKKKEVLLAEGQLSPGANPSLNPEARIQRQCLNRVRFSARVEPKAPRAEKIFSACGPLGRLRRK
jgi:hypothetical protein